MAKLGGGKRRFTNPLQIAASTTAQQLLMKPAVWSVLNVHARRTEPGRTEEPSSSSPITRRISMHRW